MMLRIGSQKSFQLRDIQCQPARCGRSESPSTSCISNYESGVTDNLYHYCRFNCNADCATRCVAWKVAPSLLSFLLTSHHGYCPLTPRTGACLGRRRLDIDECCLSSRSVSYYYVIFGRLHDGTACLFAGVKLLATSPINS
jgi:hypothetical protein